MSRENVQNSCLTKLHCKINLPASGSSDSQPLYFLPLPLFDRCLMASKTPACSHYDPLVFKRFFLPLPLPLSWEMSITTRPGTCGDTSQRFASWWRRRRRQRERGWALGVSQRKQARTRPLSNWAQTLVRTIHEAEAAGHPEASLGSATFSMERME